MQVRQKCLRSVARRIIAEVALAWMVWQALPAGNCFTQENVTRVTVTEQDDGFLFEESGSNILLYRHRPVSKDGQFERANYVHPLYNLDGHPVTEDFPDDHLHHRGIFWAWHQVRVGNQSVGDGWMTTDFKWDVVATNVDELAGGAARLSAKTNWLSPLIKSSAGDVLPIVEESLQITVHPKQENTRTMDFEVQLLAKLPQVSIGGSDDEKGYGGFSLRFKTPKGFAIHAESGLIEPILTAMDCGDWVDFSGSLGAAESFGGVAVMIHPASAGYPNQWILRRESSMQNPVFPGRTPVEMSQTIPVVMRYRLVLHRQVASKESIRQWRNAYHQLKFTNEK